MYTTHGWVSETYAEWKNLNKKVHSVWFHFYGILELVKKKSVVTGNSSVVAWSGDYRFDNKGPEVLESFVVVVF